MSPRQATRRAPSERTDATAADPTRRPAAGSADDPLALNSEDLHVRSYAHGSTHDVDVAVYASDGTVVFDTEYALAPGAVKSEINALPPGEYEVRATLDGAREVRRRCRIGDAPDETAVIEVGNGVVSVTEGFPR